MTDHMRLKPGEPVPADALKAMLGEDGILLPGEVLVPQDYVETVATLIAAKLKANGFTQGVGVAVNKDEPMVAITLARRIGGAYVLKTDCLKAWMAKQDPEEAARGALLFLMEAIERKAARN